MSSPFIKRAGGKSRLSNIRQRVAAEDDLLDPSAAAGDATFSQLASTSIGADGNDQLASSSTTPDAGSSISRRVRRPDVNNDDDREDTPSFSPMQLAAQSRKKEKERSRRKGLLGTAIAGSSSRSKLSFGLGSEEVSDGDVSVGAAPSPGASGSSSRRKLGLGMGSSALALAGATGSSNTPPSTERDGSSGALASSSSTTGGSGSTYTSAYLEELKASTPSRAAPPPSRRLGDHDFVSGDDAEAAANSATSTTDGMIVQDTTAGIPDEALIASAKAKRAAAAAGGGGGLGSGDFVSLSSSDSIRDGNGDGSLAIYDARGGGGAGGGPHPESRLQREEDELGDGDEDLAAYTEQDVNLAIGKKANKTAARRLKNDIAELIEEREAEAAEAAGVAASEDEDAMEWERAQVERANGYGRNNSQAEADSSRAKKPYRPAPMPATRPLPTVSAANARLEQSRALLESSRQNRLAHISTNERDLAMYDQQEQDLRKEVAKVEAKKEWMEEFRGWVETLGGFLEEKIPILDSIEDDMAHHYTERTEMIKTRRRNDDLDDLALFCGAAPQRQSGTDGDVEGTSSRSRGDWEDFGPHAGVRRYRRDARQQRRQRRRAVRPSTQEDGYSTDSSLDEADAEDYDAAQQILAERVQSLSDDVKAEDFRDPVVGLANRFAGWRKQYEDEYLNAYGGLAMVQAWEYWARKEMVGWEPARSKKSLDSFKWYHALHSYSRPNAGTEGNDDDEDMDLEGEAELGPEGDLVAAMVSSVVTRTITRAIEAGAYDLYSLRQTRILVDLADMIAEYAGKENSKFRATLTAILTAFVEEIDELRDMVAKAMAPDAIPPPAFDPASRSALSSFVHRQLKLASTILAWRRFASIETTGLVNRILKEILQPCLTRSWESGGQEAAAKVVQTIPANIVSAEMSAFLNQGPSAAFSAGRR